MMRGKKGAGQVGRQSDPVIFCIFIRKVFLPPPEGIVIGRVCLLVGWFVRSFVAHAVTSRKLRSPIFTKF